MPKVLLRNIGTLSVQMIASKLLYVVLIAALSRKLGVVGVAHYAFAFSFPALVFLFFDFGISELVVRDLARKIDHSRRYIGMLLPLRFALWGGGFLSTLGLIVLVHVDAELVPLIILVALIVLLNYLTSTFGMGFWSSEDIHLQALVEAVSDTTGIMLALGLLLSGRGLLWILFALLVGRVVGFLFGAWLFIRRVGMPELSIDVQFWKSLIRDAVPFMINSVLLTALFRLDVVMVGLLVDDKALGLFSSAFLVMKSLIFFIQYQAYVFYPRLSILWEQDRRRFSHLLRKGFLVISSIGTGALLAVMLLASPIISIIFGSGFEATVPILRILLMGGFFLTLLMFVVLVLNASGRQWGSTKILFASLVLNLVLNLAYIPSKGGVGAAYATMIAYIVTFMIASFTMLRTKLVDNKKASVFLG